MVVLVLALAVVLALVLMLLAAGTTQVLAGGFSLLCRAQSVPLALDPARRHGSPGW
jgi:hypothetical protein